jgi:hypothetical protein
MSPALRATLSRTLFGADPAHGLIDDALYLVRAGIGVACLDFLNGAEKHAPADSLISRGS